MDFTRIVLLLVAMISQSCVFHNADPQFQASLEPPVTSIVQLLEKSPYLPNANLALVRLH